MSLEVSIVEEEKSAIPEKPVKEFSDCPTKIKVVGCGGGGSNAVNGMIERAIVGVDFVVLNTDLQALNKSNAAKKLAIGQKVTKGLGAGGDPQVGQDAAEEDRDMITDELRGADMVFITAGMGGGTGTGSAPVVASIAKDLGALTVAVVTTPFFFEGNVRMQRAKAGLEKLQKEVDSLIVIPNEQLFNTIDKNTTVKDSFKMADEILCQGVEGISNIIQNPGDVNTDFADVKNAMAGQGNAIFGIGVCEGENRAQDAAYAAIHNPMLENSHIDGAKNILINICASEEVGMFEVRDICNTITGSADQNYNLFWGQVTDPNMGGKISVTVIATGFDAAKASEEKAKVAEQVKPKVVSNETLFSSDEFSSILTPRKTKESAPQPVVEKSETQVKSDNAHPASESETQKPWGENLFNDTEVKPVRGTLKVDPPEDVDVNDLEKPAIWANKKLNRFIRLDEE